MYFLSFHFSIFTYVGAELYVYETTRREKGKSYSERTQLLAVFLLLFPLFDNVLKSIKSFSFIFIHSIPFISFHSSIIKMRKEKSKMKRKKEKKK